MNKGELTSEVIKLAILIAKELQKNPADVSPEMLMALRGCAQILEQADSGLPDHR